MWLLLAVTLLGLALISWGLYLIFNKVDPDVSGLGDKRSEPSFFPDYPRATVKMGAHEFQAAVADTIQRRTLGLSGCPRMPATHGLLFKFAVPGSHPFWMKDMLFPLDMIWIRRGKVVDISVDVPVPAEGASAMSLPKVWPAKSVDHLLEVNAGEATTAKIKIGDSVRIVYND